MALRRKKRNEVGIKAPFPSFVEPVLAEQVDRVPRGARWIYEIKYDGYRGQLHIANQVIRIFTRGGLDWTRQFAKVAHEADLINAKSVIIDGEIVAPGEDGKTDFARLQKSLNGGSSDIGMIVFDLLYLDGRDLRRMPLVERKAALKALIAGSQIVYSEHFDADGAELFRRVCAGELEGVVSKIADSPYGGLRGNYWVKTTCAHRETLAIAGFRIKENRFDGIYVGRQHGDKLVYAGKVEHGFEDGADKELQRRLRPLVRKTQPFAKRIPNNGVWVEPQLLAELNIAQSRATATCGIPPSRVSERICEHGAPDSCRADRTEL